MTTARDNLAAIIEKSGDPVCAADDILAAGWSAPPTVLRTVEDVAAHWWAVFIDEPAMRFPYIGRLCDYLPEPEDFADMLPITLLLDLPSWRK